MADSLVVSTDAPQPRRYDADVKQQFVAQALVPGASVPQIAQAHADITRTVFRLLGNLQRFSFTAMVAP